MIIAMRPVAVAVSIALGRHTGREARVCRVEAFFPDIGLRYRLYRVGFLRYSGEPSLVAPEATEQELELQPGLTANFEWSKDHGWERF